MSEAYLTNWLASNATDERNHFHEIAIHEARIASEVRGASARASRIDGLVDRVRAAIPGLAPIQRCDCPVAA